MFTIDGWKSVVNDNINPLPVPPKPEVEYSSILITEPLIFRNAPFD